MSQEIDVYYLTDSKLEEKLNKIVDKDEKEYSLKFKKLNDSFYDKKCLNEIVFFEEEDSYLTCVDIYDKIVSLYKKKPVIIIISTNKDVFNVVRWIRKGASDYILLSELKKDVFHNSIKGSINFVNNKASFFKKGTKEVEFVDGRILAPGNIDWTCLEDNKYFDMALLKINIVFSKESIGRYSKASVEKIYEQIKNELSLIAQNFGGRVWFWQNSSGVITFHFGDTINCAVLTGMYFYNHFFLICLEKLKLDEILKFKISIHYGNCLYHKSNTDQITSDLINSLVHLENQFTKDEDFVLTNEVFKKLSPRLVNHFNKAGMFEGRDIYIYKT